MGDGGRAAFFFLPPHTLAQGSDSVAHEGGNQRIPFPEQNIFFLRNWGGEGQGEVEEHGKRK
jgi:hypothetical protein